MLPFFSHTGCRYLFIFIKRQRHKCFSWLTRQTKQSHGAAPDHWYICSYITWSIVYTQKETVLYDYTRTVCPWNRHCLLFHIEHVCSVVSVWWGDGTESHSGRLCSDSTSLNVRISKMKHFSFSFFFAGIITPHKDPAPPPARVSVENSTETRPLTFDATRKQ